MATAAFKNFLMYPHGKANTVDGIDYEAAKFVICPKCWVKYIYIYLILIIMAIVCWFAVQTSDIGASVAVAIFGVVLLTISEITMPRLLPGTITCQDIPFPPQSGEVINRILFMRLVFKYTSEESKTRFVMSGSREEESEIESEDGLFCQNLSEIEQESKDNLFHQKGPKNNLHLGKFEEIMCRRREFEVENESKDVLFISSMSEESHESESDMLRKLFKADMLHQQTSCGESEAGLFHRPLPEGESKANLMSEGESNAGRFPEGESKALLLPEGKSKAPLLPEGKSKAALSRQPLSEGKS